MALVRVPKENVPEGAVWLNESKVHVMQRDAVYAHNPGNEVFFLKYGGIILGAASALSGFLILRHFRAQFLLKHEGQFSSYLPTSVIPALGSQIVFNQVIRKRILIEDNVCPICLEMKACVFQVTSAVLWPLCLAPLASLLFAVRTRSFNVPFIVTDFKAFFRILMEKAKPGKKLFAGLTAFQLVAASFVTFSNGTEYIKFRRRCLIRAELANS